MGFPVDPGVSNMNSLAYSNSRGRFAWVLLVFSALLLSAYHWNFSSIQELNPFVSQELRIPPPTYSSAYIFKLKPDGEEFYVPVHQPSALTSDTLGQGRAQFVVMIGSSSSVESALEELETMRKASGAVEEVLTTAAALSTPNLTYQKNSQISKSLGLSPLNIPWALLETLPFTTANRILWLSPSGSLFPVYVLKSDVNMAFVSGTVPSGDKFELVNGNDQIFQSSKVPVPLSFPSAAGAALSLPLAGLKVGVKDIFDIAGTRTGCGNLHYASLYGTKETTCPAIQRLIELGAEVVGKTKTSQFANGEGVGDWADQFCPYNPRGDGRLDPTGSSTGSAAALAAYNWLDFTIGSDTGGSIRGPANAQGLFGIRPSVGAVSLQGVMPLSNIFDAAGYFTRSAELFQKIGKAWYGDTFKSYDAFPKTILLPHLEPQFVHTNETKAMFQDFIANLTAFLGVDERTGLKQFDVQREWARSMESSVLAGEFAEDVLDLNGWLNETYATVIGYEQASTLGKKFAIDFALENDGRLPSINTSPTNRWKYGLARGAQAYTAEILKVRRVKEWIEESVLTEDEESCSNALMITLMGTGKPVYRKLNEPELSAPTGPFMLGRLSVFAGFPEAIFPIGQVSYCSEVSNHIEYLPVTVSVAARQGCDYVIMDLAEALKKAGVLRDVRVGSLAFDV